MIKKGVAVVLIVVLLGAMVACQSDSQQIIGGDAVCYSYCVFPDEEQLASIPLISKKKIKTVVLEDYQCNDKDVFLLTEEVFDAEECYQYEDYYIYFIVLKIQANTVDRVVHSSIDSLDLQIDGRSISLKTPDFKVSNGVEGILPENYDDGTLLFGGAESSTLVWSNLPTKDRMAKMSLVTNKDIVLNSFVILDYFSVDTLNLNDKEVDSAALNTEVKQNGDVTFSYSLQYANGSDDKHIVRTARYVVFTEDGQKKAFIDGAGMYVYPGYADQRALKNYIDGLNG